MRRNGVMLLPVLGVCLFVSIMEGHASPMFLAAERFPLRVQIGLDPFTVRLKVVRPPAGKPRLHACLVTFYGETVDRSPVVWDADGGGVRFTLHPKDFGLYSVVVRAEDATVAFRTRYAVLRPLPERYAGPAASRFRFGVNTHFDQRKGDLEVLPELIAQAGFRWVRDTFSWGRVESEKGRFRVPEFNRRAIAALRKRGVQSLLCLCYGNRWYPHATEAEAAGYGRYAEFAARELKGQVSAFEIWNEPNAFAKLTPEQYCRILEAGFHGVKQGNPGALVVGMGGPAAGGWGGWYIPTVLKRGGQAWMDSFGIHPYCSPHVGEVGYLSRGGPAPRSSLDYLHQITLHLAEKIREARGFARRPGVWITEIGWPTTQVSETAQAQQIARFLIYCAARPHDIERTFIYDFLCDGPDLSNKEHTFGLVYHDYSPRPAYVAAAGAARAVDGLPFLRRIRHPYDGVHLYLFGTERNAVLAGWVAELSGEELENGWMADGTPAKQRMNAGSWPDRVFEVELSGVRGRLELHDWQDRARPIEVGNDGRLHLRLSPWPQYVYGIERGSEVTVGRSGPKDE